MPRGVAVSSGIDMLDKAGKKYSIEDIAQFIYNTNPIDIESYRPIIHKRQQFAMITRGNRHSFMGEDCAETKRLRNIQKRLREKLNNNSV